jgi:hypothetical protein
MCLICPESYRYGRGNLALQVTGTNCIAASAESTISAGSKASIGGTVGSALKDHLKGVDKKLAKVILDEVVDGSPGVAFDDIVGLKDAVRSICSTGAKISTFRH